MPWKKHRPVASHWPTLSYNIVSSNLHHERDSNFAYVVVNPTNIRSWPRRLLWLELDLSHLWIINLTRLLYCFNIKKIFSRKSFKISKSEMLWQHSFICSYLFKYLFVPSVTFGAQNTFSSWKIQNFENYITNLNEQRYWRY